MNKIIVWCVFLALAGEVSAVTGAHCEGNTLVYYDLFNTPVKRDCSILHSAQGQVYRGECRPYDGGADCWRTAGTVTPSYRDAIRGYVYNSTDPWGASYNPPNITVTSTTIPAFDFGKCPVCKTCDICENCTVFKYSVFSINETLYTCKTNLDACTNNVNKMIYRDSYEEQKNIYENKIKILTSDMAAKDKEIARLTSNSSIYFYLALACGIIVVFVIGVWVKYEWIGDPKVKRGFGDIKN